MSGGGSEEDRVEFTQFRQRMNQRILEPDNQVVRRFFALDTQTYKDGALPLKTKELLGLVASMVLRCDDCISYHIAQCREAGANRDEFFETFSVGIGGGRQHRHPALASRRGLPRSTRERKREPRAGARSRMTGARPGFSVRA
jgi:AhpD family alkylhydroperoxidase